ncbi:MAG: cytochrome oxidase small assembly protein [Janthinobacterium lividum]
MTLRDKAAQKAANLRLALVLAGIVAIFFFGAMVQHMLGD